MPQGAWGKVRELLGSKGRKLFNGTDFKTDPFHTGDAEKTLSSSMGFAGKGNKSSANSPAAQGLKELVPGNKKAGYAFPEGHPPRGGDFVTWPVKLDTTKIKAHPNPKLEGFYHPDTHFIPPGPTNGMDFPYDKDNFVTTMHGKPGDKVIENMLIQANNKHYSKEKGIYYMISDKVIEQQKDRQWTHGEVEALLENPYLVKAHKDTRQGQNPLPQDWDDVTLFYTKDFHYIARSNQTGEIIAISEKNPDFRDDVSRIPLGILQQFDLETHYKQ